jgi:site-specific DNA recombinase
MVDLPLVKALVRAESWRARMNRSYAQRVARIAFLSPDLKRAILDGRQPPKLSLRRLLQEDIPSAWQDQAIAWA